MSPIWTVLLLRLIRVTADEVEKVFVHEIPSKIDIGMEPSSSITCEDSTGLIYPKFGFGWRICFERSNCFPAFKKISKDRALARKILEYFSQMTQKGPAYIRNICYLKRLEVSLIKSEKVLKWHWVCSNEARAKRRFFEDLSFCDRNPNGTRNPIFSKPVSNGKSGSGHGEGKAGGKGKTGGEGRTGEKADNGGKGKQVGDTVEKEANKSANKTNKIEQRNVQPTRLYRKHTLTPVENTILIVAIGVTFVLALCLVCIVALQCCCAQAQALGGGSESDSKSSLSPISSPIILEMLKLELERQKRKQREESIESDEDDSPV